MLVVAEIGSNHCGSRALGRELVKAARMAGADAAKFQWTSSESWASPAEWEKRQMFQVSLVFLEEMKEACDEFGIEFMCTPFSPMQVDALDPLVKRWKIASAEAGRNDLVDRAADTGKPMILSTGFIVPEKAASYWRGPDWTLLRCVAEYPANPHKYGLADWATHMGDIPWGISDHTFGIGASIAAVSLGAVVVEKHFALTDQPESPDSGAHALRPTEFRRLAIECRIAAAAVEGTAVVSTPPRGRRVW